MIQTTPTEAVEATSVWSECGTTYAAYVNPYVLQSRYGYPTLTATGKGSVAVAEFQEQYYDTADLKAFATQCGLTETTVSGGEGTNDESYCDVGLERCIEALLDVEYIGQVAAKIPLYVYYSSTYSIYDYVTEIITSEKNTIRSISKLWK